eukprot:SAG31_NODE_3697_length_3978_cov_1.827791_2_plen_295_part_00
MFCFFFLKKKKVSLPRRTPWLFLDRKLGTLDHFDHLILENALIWGNGSSNDCPHSDDNGWDSPSCVPKTYWSNTTLIAESVLPMFARMFHGPGRLPHINTGGKDGWFHYMEANIAGRIPYPQGIKFVVLSFPQLFGTPNATGARKWCEKWGWPLLWALGPNDQAASHMMGGGSTAVYAVDADDRMLDPHVLAKIPAWTNLTEATSSAAMESFDQLWSTVAKARASAPLSKECNPWDPTPCDNGGLKPSNFTFWWSEFKATVPTALRVASLRPRQCANVDKCVGLNGDGHCVCNR